MGSAPREGLGLGLVPGGRVASVPKEIRIPPVSQEFSSLHASIAAVTLGTAAKLTEGNSVEEGISEEEGMEVDSTVAGETNEGSLKGDKDID